LSIADCKTSDEDARRQVFAYLDPYRNTPSWNYCLVGLLGLGGAMLFSFEQGAEILNFGSFLAFMGVNVAAFWQFGRAPRLLVNAVPPLLGFFCCLAIWWGLSAMTKIIGGSWLLLGIIMAAVATHGFRIAPPLLAPDES
jgi:hypothetical protein